MFPIERKTEVCQEDVRTLDEDIFGFNIPMANFIHESIVQVY
jgi:hypothetical protein